MFGDCFLKQRLSSTLRCIEEKTCVVGDDYTVFLSKFQSYTSDLLVDSTQQDESCNSLVLIASAVCYKPCLGILCICYYQE